MEETVLFKRKGEGERFERGKVKYIVKFKNDKMLAIIAELDEGAETDEYRHEGEEFRSCESSRTSLSIQRSETHGLRTPTTTRRAKS